VAPQHKPKLTKPPRKRMANHPGQPRPCPICGTSGAVVDTGRTAVFLVCPACQHTWQERRP